MTQKINWLYKARLTWPILTQAAKSKDTVSYKYIASLTSIHHRSVRYSLDRIQNFCLDESLPPLTSLVVRRNDKRPGTGFIAGGADDLGSIHQRVYSFDWNSVTNPFGNLTEADFDSSLVQRLLADPDNSEEIYALTPTRGVAQQVFRKAVLAAYQNRCAICGLSFVEALEAAHIVSWSLSEPKERVDPRNGILMCATHHRLFDAGWIWIDQDFLIAYPEPSETGRVYHEADAAMALPPEGTRMRLPDNRNLRPLLSYLSRRNEEPPNSEND